MKKLHSQIGAQAIFELPSNSQCAKPNLYYHSACLRQYKYFKENDCEQRKDLKSVTDSKEHFLATVIRHDIVEGGKSYNLCHLKEAWIKITGSQISSFELESIIMERFRDQIYKICPTQRNKSCMFIGKLKSTAANNYVDIPDECEIVDKDKDFDLLVRENNV